MKSKTYLISLLLLFSISGYSQTQFNIGSSKDAVKSVMGQPGSVKHRINGQETWTYQLATITFKDDLVYEYNNIDNVLKVGTDTFSNRFDTSSINGSLLEKIKNTPVKNYDDGLAPNNITGIKSGNTRTIEMQDEEDGKYSFWVILFLCILGVFLLIKLLRFNR